MTGLNVLSSSMRGSLLKISANEKLASPKTAEQMKVNLNTLNGLVLRGMITATRLDDPQGNLIGYDARLTEAGKTAVKKLS